MTIKKVPINFDVEHYNMIERVAKTVGLSVSAYIRMATLERIKTSEALDAQKKMVGMFQLMQEMEELRENENDAGNGL